MCPNIIIGSVTIGSWYAMLWIGAITVTALAIYLKPQYLALRRKDILVLGLVLTTAGLFGARILFIILHRRSFSEIFLIDSGFAYFGALITSLLALWWWASLKKIKILAVVDYCMPFLMLSQVFVRIGCFMAGCCHGFRTDSVFAVTFKAVDASKRHPTQIYEAVLLVLIYMAGRSIYKRYYKKRGFESFIVLALYGIGRFLIEYFRVDSPVVFYNLTLAQAACLTLALVSSMGAVISARK